MDEIFGEDNFVGQFIWETKRAARAVPTKTLLMTNHEYIICYATNINDVKLKGLERKSEDFSNPDNDVRGLWRSESMRATGNQNNFFEIINPFNGMIFKGNWAFSQSSIKQMISDNLILFPDSSEKTPRQKKFINSYINETKATVTALGWYSTENATKALMGIFNNNKLFDFPKPLDLIKFLHGQFSNPNAVILDCFAGSGTTGHAVMKLNAEDGGTRQYICVQIPEKLDPKNKNQATACDFLDGIEKPRTIAEITKERLRRAGAKIRQEHPDFQGDLGFKVFKQVPSQQLQATQGLDLTTTTEADLEALKEAQFLQQQLTIPLESVNPLHLAYEVMLKRHTYPLTAPIERITFAGHDDCFRLGSEAGALCIFATEININAIIKGLIEILEHDDSAFPSAVYMLENAFHSAGEYNDFASALEQLSTHYNIGTGKAERGEQPTLKFYTL